MHIIYFTHYGLYSKFSNKSMIYTLFIGVLNVIEATPITSYATTSRLYPPPPSPHNLSGGGGGRGELLLPTPIPQVISLHPGRYMCYTVVQLPTCKLRYIYLVILIFGYDVASLIRRRSNHCKQSSKRARNNAKFVSHLQLISCKNLVYFHALRSMLG